MSLRIAISSSRVALILAIIVMCLTIASLAAQYSMFYMDYFPLKHGFKRLVSVGGENNIPTWYSTILLFSVSLSCLAIYFFEHKVIRCDHSWHLFWLGFGGVYCFLSLDEAARLHEIIDKATSIKWP